MESPMMERTDFASFVSERPSPEFIRAVAELLETDANDILSELGYAPTKAVVAGRSAVAA